MPSIRALYNEELVEAHREAVSALRELLAQERDPAERRKLANAILRARPAKETTPAEGEGAANAVAADEGAFVPPASSGGMSKALRGQGGSPTSPAAATAREHTSAQLDDDVFDSTDDDLDSDDLNDPLHREIDQLAHQLTHGPDQLAALNKLHAIMMDTMAAITPNTSAAEST